ncbi:MAG: hypothetical protein IJS14_00960 [Lentisphaeria bacterium]|nr:hypothetical protein [Lentisphaeria bacterium]
MKVKSFAVVLGLMTVAVLVSGVGSCEKFLEDPEKALAEETDKTPRYVLTVHEIIKYKRGGMLEMDVDCFFGGTICVNKNPQIHSRDIIKIEQVPRPGNTEFFDLKLTLSERGKMLWAALAILQSENKKVGILIDGMYYRSINPPMLTDQSADTIYLEGPFDPANAKGIVENSERNYKIFNDK